MHGGTQPYGPIGGRFDGGTPTGPTSTQRRVAGRAGADATVTLSGKHSTFPGTDIVVSTYSEQPGTVVLGARTRNFTLTLQMQAAYALGLGRALIKAAQDTTMGGTK